jgi:hypothetical protein
MLGGDREPARPYLTISSARHLFSYLRERNNKIQRLILHTENLPAFERPCPDPGLHIFQSEWEKSNSMPLVCSMVYDDGAEDAATNVTCPGLSKELNASLGCLGEGQIAPLARETLPLKVALDEPLTASEWRDLGHLGEAEQLRVRQRSHLAQPL